MSAAAIVLQDVAVVHVLVAAGTRAYGQGAGHSRTHRLRHAHRPRRQRVLNQHCNGAALARPHLDRLLPPFLAKVGIAPEDTSRPGGLSSEYRGAKYYFCSTHCKTSFDKEPAKYAPKKQNEKEKEKEKVKAGPAPAAGTTGA
jgi:YHS domain-containing protein